MYRFVQCYRSTSYHAEASAEEVKTLRPVQSPRLGFFRRVQWILTHPSGGSTSHPRRYNFPARSRQRHLATVTRNKKLDQAHNTRQPFVHGDRIIMDMAPLSPLIPTHGGVVDMRYVDAEDSKP